MTAVPVVVRLDQAAGLPRTLLGGKAAPLAQLAAAGFPVPAGLVVTTAAWRLPDERLAAAIGGTLPEIAAGGARLAVRSSATAEDTDDASYAGQYETYLDVPVEQVVDAVQRCRQAAAAARVKAYRSDRGADADPDPEAEDAMAVLIQPMVPAAAAGVAFTANPLTGDRSESVITAVRGLGDRLVGGQADGDEWLVRGRTATPRRVTEQAITAEQAAGLAALAADVARTLQAGPLDIEWVIGPAEQGSRVLLLQARPMTALPDPVDWTPPGPGLWMRNFRLGEWLPDPMTPLFTDWLLPLIEDGYLDGMHDSLAVAVPFPYAAVNGWYYNTTPHPNPRLLLTAVAISRGRIVPVLYQALFNVSRDPAAADRTVLDGLHRQWRDRELPAYRELVANAARQLPAATPAELVDLVEQIGQAAGRQLWFLAVVGGSAWKMEGALARFADRHLPRLARPGAPLADGVQALLRGLDGIDLWPPPHAVASIDWYWPTLGETRPTPRPSPGPDRHAALVAERQATETACLTALHTPRQRRQFAELLTVTRRYATIREHQARDLTLGWPVLRACAQRIGEHLTRHGALDQPDQIFFLHRDELDPTPGSAAAATNRHDRWQVQRRQLAPLTLGRPPKVLGDPIRRAVDRARSRRPLPADAVIGQPASAGRAAGTVRVLTNSPEQAAFQAGEILVAPATTPAWTPLFAIAAAVVTDTGALTAHASIVAREYGIPAVVGTGDATRRLRTGQLVLVDGSAGTVTPLPAPPDARAGNRDRSQREQCCHPPQATPASLRSPSNGTRWANQQLHLLFGYLLIRRLRPPRHPLRTATNRSATSSRPRSTRLRDPSPDQLPPLGGCRGSTR